MRLLHVQLIPEITKVVSIFLLSTTFLSAQINVDNEILSKIPGKAPRTIIAHGTPYDLLGGPTIEDLQIYSVKVQLKEDELVKLPEEIVYDVYKNVNCSEERRGWVETLTLNKKVIERRSASFTSVLNSSKTLTAKITLPKISGSASRTEQVTLTNKRGWSKDEIITSNVTRPIDLNVNKNKVLFVKLKKTIYSVEVPFSATLVVDGTYKLRYKKRHTGFKPPYVDKVIKFSNVLNESQRTFNITGFIRNSSASALEIGFDEKDVRRDIDCVSSVDYIAGSELAKKYKETGDENLLLNWTFSDFTTSMNVGYKEEEKLDFNLVIEEYSGSTTITTSNSTANVWVRHLSFGPGFCVVDTNSSSGNSITTSAPPAFWSDWEVIDSHIGEVTLTLTNDVKCDTGVRSEVKYYKK